MAQAKITASTTVKLSDAAEEAGHSLSIELDGRSTDEGGYNYGKSSFFIGDEPVFLITHSEGLRFEVHVSTGSISTLATESVPNDLEGDEYLTFIDGASVSLAEFPNNSPSFNILTGTPGSSSKYIVSGQEVTPIMPEKVPGADPVYYFSIVKTEYNYTVYPIRLKDVTVTYPVVIFVVGYLIDE